jgi:hypothetical protein
MYLKDVDRSAENYLYDTFHVETAERDFHTNSLLKNISVSALHLVTDGKIRVPQINVNQNWNFELNFPRAA